MLKLSDFQSDYMPSLIGGLAGTAVGGGLGYFGSGQRPDESEEDFSTRRLQNAGTGAIAGAATGAGAPIVYDHIAGAMTDNPGPLRKALQFLNPTKYPTIGGTTLGAVGGSAIGAAAMSGKERLAKGVGEFDRWMDQLKNTTGPLQQVNAQKAQIMEQLRRLDQNSPLYKKLIGTEAEKMLLQHGAPKAMFAGRRGGRWGALLGALGFGLWSNASE